MTQFISESISINGQRYEIQAHPAKSDSNQYVAIIFAHYTSMGQMASRKITGNISLVASTPEQAIQKGKDHINKLGNCL